MPAHPFLRFLGPVCVHGCPFRPVRVIVGAHGGFLVRAALFVHEAPEESEVVAAVGVAVIRLVLNPSADIAHGGSIEEGLERM